MRARQTFTVDNKLENAAPRTTAMRHTNTIIVTRSHVVDATAASFHPSDDWFA